MTFRTSRRLVAVALATAAAATMSAGAAQSASAGPIVGASPYNCGGCAPSTQPVDENGIPIIDAAPGSVIATAPQHETFMVIDTGGGLVCFSTRAAGNTCIGRGKTCGQSVESACGLTTGTTSQALETAPPDPEPAPAAVPDKPLFTPIHKLKITPTPAEPAPVTADPAAPPATTPFVDPCDLGPCVDTTCDQNGCRDTCNVANCVHDTGLPMAGGGNSGRGNANDQNGGSDQGGGRGRGGRGGGGHGGRGGGGGGRDDGPELGEDR